MDDKMLQLISAYVDGQASPAESEQAEALIRQDPQARQAYDEMKTFCGTLAATVPAEVAPPDGFREMIMHRIHLTPGMDPKGPHSGGGMGKLLTSPYMVSGLVLTGLLGTFAYLDHMEKPPYRVEGVKQEALTSFKNEGQPSLPDYRGTPSGPAASSVDIQELQTNAANSKNRTPADLKGDVFLRGQGAVNKAGAVLPGAIGRNLDLSQLSRGKASDSLENPAAGSAAQLSQRYPDLDANNLMFTARANSVNPGLLAAAVETLNVTDLDATAHRMHTSLEASQGQSEPERLARLISDLGGDVSLLPKWKAMLQSSGQ